MILEQRPQGPIHFTYRGDAAKAVDRHRVVLGAETESPDQRALGWRTIASGTPMREEDGLVTSVRVTLIAGVVIAGKFPSEAN
jgi:hypothetical protein